MRHTAGLAVALLACISEIRVDAVRARWSSEDNVTYRSSVRLREGMLFVGRRQLVRKRLSGDPFPAQIQGHLGQWSNGRKLGRGSFGEVWEASGDLPGRGRTAVALKIFYREVEGGEIVYLTPGNLKPEEADEINEIKQECDILQRIKNEAKKKRDIAEHRLVGCFEVHNNKEKLDDPIYVILEGGGESVQSLIDDDKLGLDEARTIIGHILQALRFMGETMKPPLIHHDLKPENAVYDRAAGIARLIDFGAVMTATKNHQHDGFTSSDLYRAPETLDEAGEDLMAFAFPATSYDMFALGIMYAELMCPGVDEDTLDEWKTDPKPKLCDEMEDVDYGWIMKMISGGPQNRPSPSQVLANAPFNKMSLDAVPPEEASPQHWESDSESGDDDHDCRKSAWWAWLCGDCGREGAVIWHR